LSSRKPIFVIGTYTNRTGFSDEGAGILILDLNEESGTLCEISRYEDIENPSYLACDSASEILFAVSENNEDQGHVSSFRLIENRRLEQCSRVQGPGKATCHVSFSCDRRLVFASSYSEGRLSIHSYGSGLVEEPLKTISYSGSGPNLERQAGPHAHQAVLTPDGNYLLVCDLGADTVHIHNLGSLLLSGSEGAPFPLPPGSGPRHLAFIPGTDLVLLVCELIPLAFLLKWFPDEGKLKEVSSISVVDESTAGRAQPGGVKIHPSGRSAAVSCRGTNTISVLTLPEGGGWEFFLAKEINCGGLNPRDLEFSKSGKWLLTANQDSSELSLMEFDPKTGLPKEQSCKIFPVGTPTAILAL